MNGWPKVESLDSLTDHQREQYALATTGHIGVLAGRPGTGKTFVTAAIIKSLSGRRLAAAAPTGKAAVRMAESLAKAGASGIKPTTIHSLLGVDSADGDWTFVHNEFNKLALDYIFVDEASMIDAPLCGSLLAARPSGCRVLFIGDPNQLSPVGHGAPLRDMIAAGLPCGELMEIQRNTGRIVRACHAIIDKRHYEPAAKLDPANGENLLHLERMQPNGQIEELKTILGRMKDGGRWDVVRDVQVIVPVNAKSPLGRKPLNKILQGFLNPTGKQAAGNPFRVGDKIVNGKNGWLPVENFEGEYEKYDSPDCNADQNDDGKVYVANGEQGIVVGVMPNYTIAKLEAPSRLLRIPKGKAGGGGGDNDNGNGEDSTDTGCNWELAYAISAHKSQGSEWPVVVVMIDSYPGATMLCTREWLYTALSRGKEIVLSIGRKTIADSMCRKSGLWQRKTFLKEEIEGLRVAAVEHAWDKELETVGD